MTTKKRDMKGMLKSSMQEEDRFLDQRFKAADVALGVSDQSTMSATTDVDTEKTPPQNPKTEKKSLYHSKDKPIPESRPTEVIDEPSPPKLKPSKRETGLIRDTFSMPATDHAMIAEIRQLLIEEHALVLNKSEILRAGLHALRDFSPSARLRVAKSIETLKPGRKS